jgi:hypothetical protein
MPAPAILAYDNWAEDSASSFSHAFDTGSGSDMYLVVGIRNQNTNDNVNAPTYNGVAMSLLYKRQNTQAQSLEWMYYFGLAAPASGSHTLAFTSGAAIAPFWFVYSFSDAKQTAQPNFTAANADDSANLSFSVTGTSTVNDVFLVGQSDDNNGGMSAGANTTERSTWGNGFGQTVMDSNSLSNSAGSVTLNVTGSNGGKSDFTMIGIAPVASSVSAVAVPPALLFMGVG